MKIKVRIKNNFGRKEVHPVCAKAKLFVKIAKRTCLSPENLDDIKKLGFEVEVEQAKL